MLKITRRLQADDGVQQNLLLTLSLPYETRKKSRFKAQLDNGEEVGLMLDRGKVLRDGDLLLDENDRVIRVCAAEESVTTVIAGDPTLFARICYHLGNRHVPLQVSDGWARYLHDHVLDDMVRQLGGQIVHESAAFEPESGAYGGGHHHDH